MALLRHEAIWGEEGGRELSKNEYQIPDGLHYSKDHEWVKVDGSRARVGVTDYAQSSLNDVVYVELPELERVAKQFEAVGAVESVKAASDIFSPVSGKILEVNKRLEEEPELINKEPYGAGWIMLLEASSLQEDLTRLMDSAKYSEFLKGLRK